MITICKTPFFISSSNSEELAIYFSGEEIACEGTDLVSVTGLNLLKLPEEKIVPKASVSYEVTVHSSFPEVLECSEVSISLQFTETKPLLMTSTTGRVKSAIEKSLSSDSNRKPQVFRSHSNSSAVSQISQVSRTSTDSGI